MKDCLGNGATDWRNEERQCNRGGDAGSVQIAIELCTPNPPIIHANNGNMLVRQNHKFSAYSELYHLSTGVADNGAYDQFNELQHFARGTVSAASGSDRPNQIASPVTTQSWSHTGEIQHWRNMPPDDVKDRPMFQGSFDEGGDGG